MLVDNEGQSARMEMQGRASGKGIYHIPEPHPLETSGGATTPISFVVKHLKNAISQTPDLHPTQNLWCEVIPRRARF